jgi:hypothetical protein
MRLYVFVVLVSLGLLACSEPQYQKQVDDHAAAMSQSVVVAVASPGFDLPPGSKLAWLEDMLVVHEQDRQVSVEIIGYVQNEIERQLSARGYRFVRDTGEAKYLVAAVAVLGDAMTPEQMAKAFKLYPALAGNDSYEKGTLLLGLLSPATKQAQWRGAIQAFADPGLPRETRKARGQAAVARLLAKLPG